MENHHYKKTLEVAILVIIIIIGLYLGLAPFKGTLNHEYPTGYFASDPFWHQGASDCLSITDQTAYYCSYMVMGHRDIPTFNPPILYHLTVIFAQISGLEIHDAIPFLTILSVILSILVIYLLAKEFNQIVALLTLPFTLLIFKSPFYTSFLWGQWLFIFGSFYLVALFWVISKIENDLEYDFVFLSLFLTTLALLHFSELVFGGLFLLLYLTIKKWKWSILKRGIFSGIIFGVLSFYYLVLFYASYIKKSDGETMTLAIQKTASGFPTVYFKDFGILLMILFGAGLLIGAYFLLFQRKKSIALLSCFFMFLIGYSNYIYFENRAFQTRFFWPIYLAIFGGLLIYIMITLQKDKIFSKEGIVPYLVVFALIVCLAYFVNGQKIENDGLMDKGHWQGITFFHNVPEESKVLFVYGDIYSQDQMLWNTRRLTNRVNIEYYVQTVQQAMQKQDSSLKIKFLMDPITTFLPHQISLFSYEQYTFNRTEKSICDYDYLVFDLQGQYPPLIQYELAIRQNLLTKGNLEVLNNGVVSIIQNKKVGGECFG